MLAMLSGYALLYAAYAGWLRSLHVLLVINFGNAGCI
jgi:hypothetical protein